MEQPPGSLDDLQPQDLSWHPNPATGNPGLPFSETDSSDTTLLSGEQLQPDNAFSHTTVTLSYMSRSHVFSSHNSLPLHSALYDVQPISKLSFHPPDTNEKLGDTGYALNQHYLEQVDGPVDLATQTELFQSLSQAHVGPANNRGMQEFNGGVISSNWDKDNHVKGETENSLSLEMSQGFQNGKGDSCLSSGVCADSPETLTPATVEDEERSDSEVLFLMSKKQDPAVRAKLCSLSREYMSPLEDPVSPAATSLDNVEDVFTLPQASSSPSGDNSCPDTAEEAAWDGLRTEGAIQEGFGISNSTTKLDSSAENRQPVHKRKAVLEPLIDLTDDVCVSDVSENKIAIPHMNGNAKASQRTLKGKKLPVRSGRGTRLEAIVMDINPIRFKVSGCPNKKAKAFQSTVSDSEGTSSQQNDILPVGKRKSRTKAPVSVKTVKPKAMKRGKTNNKNTDNCNESTSDSEINNSTNSNGSPPPRRSRLAVQKKLKEPEDVSHMAHSPQTSQMNAKRKPSSQSSPLLRNSMEPENASHSAPSVERSSPALSSKSPKKSQGKGKATGSKASAKPKGARTPRRKQKKQTWIQSTSIFSPKEPEIKLKYVNYKEEKRPFRVDNFSPFIRVETKSLPSLHTVINYPEEVERQHKKGPQQPAQNSVYVSAVIPSTSCLQLGRASLQSQHQRTLVCCLCGGAANAMDLGDLHGPYYPEGYRPSTKTASASDLKQEADSDSDSSSCDIRGRGGKRAVPSKSRPLRPGAKLKQRGLLESQRWTADGNGSPASKRARAEAGSADVEDWYSPPMLPLEPCEYWLHEDCGIWAAGVFLVKGKVYGLEEAVKVAQETMCSACSEPGATLGCFFKGCPNKYHYRCALESGGELIEENLSMKCKKHKNKRLKAPPGNRRDDG
ncbi:retinoic acid-induced protein 1 isoform X2 [Eleginops maclovinus]